jgi:hypothetical protein
MIGSQLLLPIFLHSSNSSAQSDFGCDNEGFDPSAILIDLPDSCNSKILRQAFSALKLFNFGLQQISLLNFSNFGVWIISKEEFLTMTRYC